MDPATVHMAITRSERTPFIVFVAASIVGAVIAARLGIPAAGLVLPCAAFAVLAIQSVRLQIILLFATYSVSLTAAMFSADVLLVLGLLGTWVSQRMFATRKSLFTGGIRRVALANALWVSLVFVWHLSDSPLSLAVISVATKLALYYVLFAVLTDLVAVFTRRQVVVVLWWAWTFAVVVSSVAVFQYYVLEMTRIHSILESNHAHLGNYGLVAMIVGGVLFTLAEGRWQRILCLSSIPLFLLGTIVSQTRADWIGAIVGLVLFGMLRGIKSFFAIGIVVALVAVSGLVSHIIEKEIQKTMTGAELPDATSRTSVDMSSIDRVLIWVGILSLEQQAPLLDLVAGFGPGQLPRVLYPHTELFRTFSREPEANGAHNNFLHVLVECGIGGLLLFLAFFVRVIRDFSRVRRTGGVGARLIGAVVIAGTLALLVSGFTQETLYAQTSMGNLFGFYLATLALSYRATTLAADGSVSTLPV